MGEPGREEYKIQSFDAETQQLLKTALKGERGGPPEPGLRLQTGGPGTEWEDPASLPPIPVNWSQQHNPATQREASIWECESQAPLSM